ncbi:MAG: DUF2786 domain-containing protein [Desulfovibrionaceae bacterium]|nr:DUF2786 domain-containing protein [Desulfovibrionaceae bacterium]
MPFDTDKETIIAKIQKILSLAERAGSDEEAQNAMLQARRMLIKYNISMEEVNSFKDEECDEVTVILKKRFVPSYTHFLAGATARLYNSRVLITYNYNMNRNRQKIAFIGVGIDPKLACQTYNFLSQYLKRRSKELKLIGRRETDYNYGFAQVVYSRCREMTEEIVRDVPQEAALVPIKDATINSYMDRAYPNRSKCRSNRERPMTAAMVAGMEDGKRVNLGRPIDHTKKAALGPN